jgi:hypothetical protein
MIYIDQFNTCPIRYAYNMYATLCPRSGIRCAAANLSLCLGFLFLLRFGVLGCLFLLFLFLFPLRSFFVCFLRPLSSPPLAARNLARPSATWSISLAPRLDVALINRLGCCSSRTKLALLNHGPPAIISATTLPTCQSPFQPGRNGSTHPPTSPRAHHTHQYSAHCCASLASDLPFLVSTATECSVFWTGMRRTKGALK